MDGTQPQDSNIPPASEAIGDQDSNMNAPEPSASTGIGAQPINTQAAGSRSAPGNRPPNGIPRVRKNTPQRDDEILPGPEPPSVLVSHRIASSRFDNLYPAHTDEAHSSKF